jgi:lantibiotic modifying enzyme
MVCGMTAQPTKRPPEQGAPRAGSPRSGWWAPGLALAERPVPSGEAPALGGRSGERVARWRAGYGPTGGFAARLATVGLDEDSLHLLLAETPADLAARTQPPAWVGTVERALLAARPERVAEPDWRGAFTVVLRPFVTNAVAELTAMACATARHADLPAIAERCAERLSRALLDLATRTLLHELNLRLSAGTVASANDFAAALTEPTALADLLGAYPVLARLLAQTADQHTAATVELLGRFSADRADIVASLLDGVDPGELSDVDTGAGDRHRRGRSVAVLTFDDGRRVVYKPRDLIAHERFGGVLAWLNDALPGLDLYVVPALVGDGYGWLAHVPSRPLADLAAADRFYRRQGALLALLHALYAADIHLENVIACGDQPVLVDVETLFHPSLAAGTGAVDPAARLLSDSVQRTGLLPITVVGQQGSADLSGLGGSAANRPRLDGRALDVVDHERALLDGFRAAYDTITRRREEFIGLLDGFADVEVRVAVRHSRGYLTLLAESTRPELLRDALDRDAAFDVLWTESAHHPLRWLACRLEQRDLWATDVPLFTTRPASADLWGSDGQRLPAALPEAGLDTARARVRAMGDVDRRDQEWVISAALATRAPAGAHRGTETRGRLATTAATPERLLAAACAVADQIVAHTLDEGERLNWLGIELVEDRQWMVLPMGAGLANGHVGVALFLAQISQLSGIARYGEVARRALRAVPDTLAALATRQDLVAAVGCGGLHGFGGIAYGLARLTTLLADDELRAATATSVRLAAMAAGTPGGLGIATGGAGCLAAMTAVHAELGLAEAATLAGDCARQLAEMLRRADGRGGTRDGDGGFANGAAGVAWALSPHDADAARLARANARSAADDLGWCSGLAGLALAGAADPAPLLADRPVLADLSLCHGELGIAEALTALATGGQHQEQAAAARRKHAGLVLDAIHHHGATCGVPREVPTPGLLNGLAGIGYGLLRLGFDDQVPSVLLFEPTGQNTSGRETG